jgi:hypothetical protein
MAIGDATHNDYFIDIDPKSEFLAKALIGIWINVGAALIAFSVQSLYRSFVRRQILRKSSFHRDGGFNLWRASLPRVTAEVWELRALLFRSLSKGYFFYMVASLICIVTALISAASTIIANHTVVTNTAIRPYMLTGRLANKAAEVIQGANANISSRVVALDNAHAPLNELFDFIPDDTSNWVFNPGQWNNTWKGNCTYTRYTDVDLTVTNTTNSTAYQDEVPLLGNYIPSWASIDRTKQGNFLSGVGDIGTGN